MKLICIKSVQMKGNREQDRYQAFTEGKEYNARKGTCQGLNGNPYEIVPVLRTKNDKGESHIIKHLDKDTTLDDFFSVHFKEFKPRELDREIYTKDGKLRKHPPKKYECKTCGHKMNETGNIKLPGVVFVACAKCGSGKVKDNPKWRDWLELKNN